MSAYALSFSSYLPSVTSSSTESSESITKPSVNVLCNKNDNYSAVTVEVKSATVNAGALIRPKRKSKPTFSLPDDAVLFKLQICFNGRKYNAKRSFESFVKFRNDLGKELTFLPKRHANVNVNVNVNMKADSFTMNSITLPALPECISDKPTVGIPIPKSNGMNISIYNSSTFSHQNGNSGFTKLQSLLLCYYCPLLEHWLEEVLDIRDVDASTSLNNFLWEPLRDGEDDSSIPSMCGSYGSRSHKSSLSLCSIHEDFDDLSDCDE